MKTEDLKFKHEVAEAIKKIFELGKQKEAHPDDKAIKGIDKTIKAIEEETNPVSKVQEIVKTLTDDVRLQNKLLEILTRNLTIEQIEKIYESKRT